jgi:hypothetical protein
MNALTGLLDSAILDKDDALLLGQFKELVVYGDTTFDTPTAKRFRSFLASAKFKNLALEEFDKVCASFSFLGPLLTTCPPPPTTLSSPLPQNSQNSGKGVAASIIKNLAQGKEVADMARLQAEVSTHNTHTTHTTRTTPTPRTPRTTRTTRTTHTTPPPLQNARLQAEVGKLQLQLAKSVDYNHLTANEVSPHAQLHAQLHARATPTHTRYPPP